MNLAAIVKTEGARRVAIKIDERFDAAKQALATALWLRMVDHAVREHAPVMPQMVSASRISDESAGRVLMNPGSMQALLNEMEEIQEKHAWQMEADDCLQAQGVIVRLKGLVSQSRQEVLA